MRFFCWVCCFFVFSLLGSGRAAESSLLFADPSMDEVPVLFEGRICPYATCRQEEIPSPLALPLKSEPWEETGGTWVPLDYLKVQEHNFTPYSDTHFLAIKEAYTHKNPKALKKALLAAYATIDKTHYQKSANTALSYPSLTQLSLEKTMHELPLPWILCGAYLVFPMAALFFKRPLVWVAIPWGLHTAVLLLRSYVLMRPPVSNLSETFLFVPWVMLLLALILYIPFSSKITLVASSLIAAAFLPFAALNAPLQTVVAVLNSQLWLSIHVLMVVGSYGVFFLAALFAHFALLFRNKRAELVKPTLFSLYLGTFLLIVGTLLGGVWAAQSWGRFWDWDPKESWAFVSCGMYVTLIHLYYFKKVGAVGLFVGAILGLMAITFTWYGVNTLLSTGLHTYGFGKGRALPFLSFLLFEANFIAFSLYKNWKIEKKEQTR